MYINIHTHNTVKEEREISIINSDMRISNTYDFQQLYSVGLHPWHITTDYEVLLLEVEGHSSLKNVAAIGETGIDRSIVVPIPLQEEVFIKHIQIAQHVRKPIIIHCVRAHYEIIALYKKMKAEIPFIFHGFNNNLFIASKLLAVEGVYLSFGAALLLPNSNASLVLTETPFEKFFLETDNAGSAISVIFARAAQLKQCSVETLKQHMITNFNRIFFND